MDDVEKLLKVLAENRPCYATWCHEGYLDGMLGLDPDPRLTGALDYETGWLHGCEDRNDPAKIAALLPPHVKNGDQVTIPKGTMVFKTSGPAAKAGRTYTIQIRSIGRGRQANYNPSRNHMNDAFVPPQPYRVVWAGRGGYWHEANWSEIAGVNPART